VGDIRYTLLVKPFGPWVHKFGSKELLVYFTPEGKPLIRGITTILGRASVKPSGGGRLNIFPKLGKKGGQGRGTPKG